MRVMLINPPVLNGNPMVREGRCMQRKGAWTTLWPPLTLATLSALLKQRGYEVFARDYVAEGSSADILIEDIKSFKPKLIVLNTVAASLANDINVTKIIKRVEPDTFVSAVGLHATAVPESVLEGENGIDSAIIGEPDLTVVNLAEALSSGRSLEDVNCIMFRRNGISFATNKVHQLIDLDSLPMPSWEFFDLKKYQLPFSRRPFLLVTTSRGCPHDCSFCPIWIYYGKIPRFRSPEKIVDEIEYDIKRFGIHDFLFWSESFTLNEEHVNGICEEILRRNLKINWMCNSRADDVNMEMLRKMRRSGCWLIGYGVESGDERLLASTNKKVTHEQIRSAIEMAHRAGMTVVGHIIIGLPGETLETAKKTIKFAIRTKIDFAQFYCAVPFPGSKLYVEAVDKKWLSSNDWSRFEQNQSVLDYPQLSHEAIEELRRKAIRKFYLRPHSLFSLARTVYNHGDIFSFFRSLKEFLSWI